MRSVDAGGKVGRKCGQVMCWDHGLPARNERKARKVCREETTRLRRVAGETPAVPASRLNSRRSFELILLERAKVIETLSLTRNAQGIHSCHLRTLAS